MKTLLTILLLAALGLLWRDDSLKATDLAHAETRANVAEQKAQTQLQQIQQLTAQVSQLQGQLNRVAVAPSASVAGGPGPVQASTPKPAWFQQRLNGAPTVLDPGSMGIEEDC